MHVCEYLNISLGPVRIRGIVDMGTSQKGRSITVISKNIHVVWIYTCIEMYEHAVTPIQGHAAQLYHFYYDISPTHIPPT